MPRTDKLPENPKAFDRLCRDVANAPDLNPAALPDLFYALRATEAELTMIVARLSEPYAGNIRLCIDMARAALRSAESR